MNKLIDARILKILALLAATSMVAGCDKSNAENQPSITHAVVLSSDPNTVELTHPEKFALIPVESKFLFEELAVNGSFSADVSRTVAINALASGRIMEVNARLGDQVKKGQLLLKMHSPELANALTALKQARADEALAQKQFERNRFLFEQGAVISQNDFQISENAYADAKANTENAQAQVKLLNGDLRQNAGFIELRAPISGVVVEQNVSNGAAAKSLDATANLFTLADLSKLWLLCDVYENNLAQVALGDTAKIHVNAYPDLSLTGKISNIFSLLDANTRSVKVRVELDNPDGLLKPGMFATATFVSQSKVPKTIIPTTAIFRLHDKDWVFFPAGANKFHRAEVKIGPENHDGTQQVISGVNAGDIIVANALQLSSAARAENPLAFQDHNEQAAP